MSHKEPKSFRSQISKPIICFLQIRILFWIAAFVMVQKVQMQLPITKQLAPTPPTTATMAPKLTLRACCQFRDEEYCEEFQSPQEMFGIGCCNAQPMNVFEEICCEGVTRRRRQSQSDGSYGYVEYCCGNQTLSFSQTCCQGVVHNIPNGECCGSQAYPRNNLNVLCCNGVLNVNVEPGLTCCGTTPYDGGLRETCCGDSVYLKELFDGCCPVRGSNPLQFKQFNSRTHLCCDVPIERYSNTKCCYLRDDTTGQFYPKSYDSSKSCCVFPYTDVAPKNAQGTCVKVTAPPAPPTSVNPPTNPALPTTNLVNPPINPTVPATGAGNVDNENNASGGTGASAPNGTDNENEETGNGDDNNNNGRGDTGGENDNVGGNDNNETENAQEDGNESNRETGQNEGEDNDDNGG